jgi:hypothetical protein
MDKWDKWYNSLPDHTKQYLKNQPLWHDSDLVKAGLVGLIIGLILGLAF